jgi:leader peptidase (prepilin peptidase) / N-methyltransferase
VIALLLPLTLVLGLIVGSFLNVVAYRVPRRESVVSPPSHCPGCDAPIRAWDNVPVLSWLLLRGRCRSCAAPISVRYPIVEAVTGLLFAAMALRFGFDWQLPAYLYLVGIAVPLALIDADTRRLPNVIVLPSYPVVAVLLAIPAAIGGHWDAYLRAGISGFAVWLPFYVLAISWPAGMGLGDVKLVGILGALLGWISWGTLGVGMFAGFLIGSVYGLGMMIFQGGNRKTQIPFGPFLLSGAVLMVLVGQRFIDAYLNLVFS